MPQRPALIATDVDGTLTRGGKLDPAALAAITRLVAAGVAVVPVSGRPAGEVTGLCRYLPGVTHGLAENGLLEVIPDRAPRWLGKPTDKPRLRQVGERLNAEHAAALRLTGDDFCRLGDIAYERDGRDEAELVRLRDLAAEMGVHLVWSNVHVHLAESVPDKGAAVLQMAAEHGLDPRAVVTIGDAPNDAGLFVGGRFGATVGTADIAGQLQYLPEAPQYITQAREGAGFVEMAEAVLAALAGGA
ncbi:HAD hydrolase family protein [Nannocystis radixulma]|uniref:HAD hydrolase family protein n=1 Tax=Nannocystis radixulma TaxID=2995305 RepID=A0ABT5BA86_9BACT|nr:HAD hydrolase family protein [Nannocystis radixulma]MDC0671049.1 HAD hydrolase family protein [Nannocystis radixulma]